MIKLAWLVIFVLLLSAVCQWLAVKDLTEAVRLLRRDVSVMYVELHRR